MANEVRRAILVQLAIWLSLAQSAKASGQNSPCEIRFGVLVEKRNGVSLEEAVSFVWNEIRSTSSTDQVEILLETIDRSQVMTMDSILEAFIDLENDNVSSVIGRYVQPVLTASQKRGIPYFLLGDHLYDQFVPQNLISVRPRTIDLYAITVDIVRMYNWTTVAVVYERPYGSFLIESLVRSPSVQVRGWMVNRSITPIQTRDILLQVRNLDIVNVIVTCSTETTTTLLNAALGLSMLSNRHTWILPTLNDTGSMVGDYSYSGVNLMTYQLVFTRSPPKEFPIDQFPPSEYATIYDSLLALYNGVRLYREETGSCYWMGRGELIDKLSKMHLSGAMGQVSFREDGSRKGFIINILGLNLQGLYQIGTWNSSSDENERLNITQAFSLSAPITADSHINHPYKVLVVEEAPFAMLKTDHANRVGNDKYSGFAIDLLASMGELHHFSYELHMVLEGGQSDTRRNEGVWDRITQQLIDANASIAMAMPVTAAREEVIDFTLPFHVSGISLILSKLRSTSTKNRKDPDGNITGIFFLFCQPLSSAVWILLLTALSVVTANVYIVERVSSGGLTPPGGRPATTRPLVPSSSSATAASGDDSEGVVRRDEPRMLLQDTVWLTVETALLRQSIACPRTTAGRIATTGLHFFSLLVVVSYAANLTVLMTASSASRRTETRPKTTTTTLRDLLDRRETRFFTARNSDVSALLEGSSDPLLHRVWQRIVDDEGLVDRANLLLNDPGDRCVVWDSAPVRYAVGQNCRLMELGVVADWKRVAFGVPQGAVYRDLLNMAILTLLERGKIQTLQNKWLSSGECDQGGEDSGRADGGAMDGPPLLHRSLQLEELGGLFVIFSVFLAISLSIAIFEYCRHQYRIKGSCLPPDQVHQRTSINCSSSSNRASPRYDITPSSLLQTDESISMNSSKSFDMSAHHHHPHQHRQHHPYAHPQHQRQEQQHNRQTNIF